MKHGRKRKALGAAVRETLIPMVKAMGFESARTKAWRNSGIELYGHGYIRTREGFHDMFDVDWYPHGRPMFRMYFLTTQTERLVRNPEPWRLGLPHGELVTGRSSLLRRWVGFENYLWGQRQNIERTIASASEALGAMDQFLKDGTPSAYVALE